MELEKIDIEGIDIYMLSVLPKEFSEAVNEKWKKEPPWPRYQKKLIQNLSVLSEHKEKALLFPQYEKLEGEDKIYCIRYPGNDKNVRVLYTITEDSVIILLVAFLEKRSSDYRRAINVAKNRLIYLES